MKVLIITHHYLHANGGGSFASRAFINAFGEIAKETLLLYPDNGNDISNFISNNILKKGIDYNKSKIAKLLDIYKGRINRFSKLIFPEIERFKPDIVVFDNSRTSAGYINQVKKQGIKVITIHHNYEMEYYRGSKPPIFWRIPFMYYMKKAEKKAVNKSDLNLTLTNADIDLLQKHYDTNKRAKFQRIGVFEFKRESLNDETEIKSDKMLTFVISGNLSAEQTVLSLVPFLEKEYKVLNKLYPKAKLIIAGKNPRLEISRICEENKQIELIANPVDMSEVISRANIYICPVNIGGGLKLRVMDGLKAGLPVLTHNVSARGYEVFYDLKSMFIYNNVNDFESELKRVVNLYQDSRINKKEIKEQYDQEFSFQQGVLRLKNIIENYI